MHQYWKGGFDEVLSRTGTNPCACCHLLFLPIGASHAVSYTYTSIDYPGAISPGGTTANGINDDGTIVGFYRDGNGDLYRAFSLTNGTYASFSYAGSLGTLALGVNNDGTIVGYRYDSGYGMHGCSLSGTTYTSISYPGGYEQLQGCSPFPNCTFTAHLLTMVTSYAILNPHVGL